MISTGSTFLFDSNEKRSLSFFSYFDGFYYDYELAIEKVNRPTFCSPLTNNIYNSKLISIVKTVERY